MRSFEFARKITDGTVTEDKAFENAQLPEYQTNKAAGADFFAAEDVEIPSILSQFVNNLYLSIFASGKSGKINVYKKENKITEIFPTLVHTGIKADMEDDEVLELYNRSSNPKKLGLVLANSVGIIDADYYNNPDNDGEIMFAFYNFKPYTVKLKAGDRIGQGVFKKYLRPVTGLRIKNQNRTGGFGSTDNV